MRPAKINRPDRIERNRLFEDWMEVHKAIPFKVSRACGATHADREDLFQEMVLQLWHSIPAFRGDGAVTTWIYRVALNTALAWNKRERNTIGKGRISNPPLPCSP